MDVPVHERRRLEKGCCTMHVQWAHSVLKRKAIVGANGARHAVILCAIITWLFLGGLVRIRGAS